MSSNELASLILAIHANAVSDDRISGQETVELDNPVVSRDVRRFAKYARRQILRETETGETVDVNVLRCPVVDEVFYASIVAAATTDNTATFALILQPVDGEGEHIMVELSFDLMGSILSITSVCVDCGEDIPTEKRLISILRAIGVQIEDIKKIIDRGYEVRDVLTKAVYRNMLLICHEFFGAMGREWRLGLGTGRDGKIYVKETESVNPIHKDSAASLLVLAEILRDEFELHLSNTESEDIPEEETEDAEDGEFDDGDTEGFGLSAEELDKVKNSLH